MIRTFAAAVLASAALLAPVSGYAQAPAGYYVAVPAGQPTKARLLTRSAQWSLQDGAYVARKAPERDSALCQLVARETGALQSFSVGGKSYDAAALEKCNAKASGGVQMAKASPAARAD